MMTRTLSVPEAILNLEIPISVEISDSLHAVRRRVSDVDLEQTVLDSDFSISFYASFSFATFYRSPAMFLSFSKLCSCSWILSGRQSLALT